MPAAETSPWDEFTRGDIVEIDCRDDARNLQGQGLIIIKDILQGKRGIDKLLFFVGVLASCCAQRHGGLGSLGRVRSPSGPLVAWATDTTGHGDIDFLDTLV